tara:strand:+ start:12198 stop:12347 length:150 start_codon:yes stop_codon:yes gene_type:complete
MIYILTTKKGEVINKKCYNSLSDAKKNFAITKKLSVSELLRIYDVKKIT